MEFAIISIVLSIFIIPLPFSVKAFLSFKDKKIYFSLFYFRRIRLKNGYAEFKSNKTFLHYSDKKAIALYYDDLIKGNGETDVINYINATKIRYAVILDGYKSVGAFCVLSVINTVNSAIYPVLKDKYPLVNFRGDVLISETDRTNGIIFDLGICFNILSITFMLVKNMFGGKKNG